MEKLLNVNPGLLFWTIFNFLLFLFVFMKLFLKPIQNTLKTREDGIKNNIEEAASERLKAQELLAEANSKLSEVTKEVNVLVSKGRVTAAEIIAKANSEAEKVRQEKLDNAIREIQIAQEESFKQLKQDVAELVVQVTEKIIEERLTTEKDFELINKQIEKLSKN